MKSLRRALSEIGVRLDIAMTHENPVVREISKNKAFALIDQLPKTLPNRRLAKQRRRQKTTDYKRTRQST